MATGGYVGDREGTIEVLLKSSLKCIWICFSDTKVFPIAFFDLFHSISVELRCVWTRCVIFLFNIPLSLCQYLLPLINHVASFILWYLLRVITTICCCSPKVKFTIFIIILKCVSQLPPPEEISEGSAVDQRGWPRRRDSDHYLQLRGSYDGGDGIDRMVKITRKSWGNSFRINLRKGREVCFSYCHMASVTGWELVWRSVEVSLCPSWGRLSCGMNCGPM